MTRIQSIYVFRALCSPNSGFQRRQELIALLPLLLGHLAISRDIVHFHNLGMKGLLTLSGVTTSDIS